MPAWEQVAAYAPQIVFVILLLGLFWWVVIVPVKQRERKHQEIITATAVGDKIVTAGGIYGTVERLRDKTVDLRIADGVVITLDRRAIVRKQDTKSASGRS